MLLTARHLSRAFGPVVVLNDISLTVNAGDRIGLVGVNGAGKTTLLRILVGHEVAESGDFAYAPGVEWGYVPQTVPDFGDATIAMVIRDAVGGLRQLEARMRELEARMAQADGDLDAVLAEYGELATHFQARGGYELDHRIDAILTGLHISHIAPERPVATLSGGERARVNLAAILLRQPDMLLLDEPTNHLDFALAAWLEHYLAEYRGAALIVSHDRHFLNAVVTQIAEIDEHSRALKVYSGAYDAYAVAKAAEQAKWREDFTRQQDEIKELRKRIREAAKPLGHNRPARDNDKSLHNAKGENVERAKSRNINAAADLLARIEADPIPKPPKPFRFHPRFRAEDEVRSDAVLRAEGVSKAYDGRAILRDASFAVGANARIMLVAPNGAGKTTLLRLLLGLEPPDAGAIQRVARVRIGYLPQDPVFPDPRQTLLRAYSDGLIGQDDQFIAGLIGYGLFRLEDMDKRVGSLSLGQQRKLEIARLMVARPNALVLDEPSNYLSLDVLEAFETAVLDFAGPVLAVSHDRWFIERFGGEVWTLREGEIVREEVKSLS
jgi:macrolide transport system ATP-binding/permease protein